jgi:FeS assembly SUF system regulator
MDSAFYGCAASLPIPPDCIHAGLINPLSPVPEQGVDPINAKSVPYWSHLSRRRIMLRLSKLTDYAIIVMTSLAAEPDQVCSASELAEMTHLETPTVSKVLKVLAKSGLIQSFRGVNGGYRIQGNPDRVSVADVITAMEGPIGMTECSVHVGLCSQEAVCTLRSNWRRISDAIEMALSDVTLVDMARPMTPPIDVRGMRVAPELG